MATVLELNGFWTILMSLGKGESKIHLLFVQTNLFMKIYLKNFR